MNSTWQPGVKTIPPTGLVIWLSMQRFWSPLWVDRSDSHWSCVHHLGFSSYCADVVTTGGCHVTIVIYVISEGLSSDAHIKSAIHWQLSLDLHKMSYLELGYSADPHRESVQKTNWWFDWEKAPDFYWVLSSHSDREIVPPLIFGFHLLVVRGLVMTTDRHLKVNIEGLFTQRSNWMILIWVSALKDITRSSSRVAIFLPQRTTSLSPKEMLWLSHIAVLYVPRVLLPLRDIIKLPSKILFLVSRTAFVWEPVKDISWALLGSISWDPARYSQQIDLASSQEGISWFFKMEIDVFYTFGFKFFFKCEISLCCSLIRLPQYFVDQLWKLPFWPHILLYYSMAFFSP